MREKLNLYTHDGIFHADDVFACAMLSLTAEEINVVRGSDTEIPEEGDWIVFDIGGGELDHHTPENKENNGTHPGTEIPYAACGLVWKKYHEEILEAMDCPKRYMDSVYQKLETSLVLGIDAEDNAFNPTAKAMEAFVNVSDDLKKNALNASRTSFTVSQVIKDFNPTWNSGIDSYDAFMDAVSFAKDILINRIDSLISSLDGRDYVLRCIDYSADHIMIMDEFAPWEGVLYSQYRNPKANDIWYVVSPALRGGWNVQCALSDSNDRTSYRHPLPAEWYGLRYEDLQKASGIATAVFCHASGFLAGCETESDAIGMAEKAARMKQ
ncbi:MAG: MYG1 family protein [Solobacterium sp.]|nr:MYG1 family protein [Solobacterium sp.]